MENKKLLQPYTKMFLYLLSITMVFLVVVFYLVVSPSNASAAEQPTISANEYTVEMTELRLKALFPKYQFTIIEETEVPEIFAVISPKNVLHFMPASGHILMGDIWNTKGQNLTENIRSRIAFSNIEDLPLDKAIKIGNGNNIVIEVTDIDCPFCRKGSQWLDSRDDVTRFIFLFPLEQIHPEAKAKSEYILSASDKAQAYHDVVSGKFDGQTLPQHKTPSLLQDHLQVAQTLGVRGTPNYWVNGVMVSGANISKIEELLN